MSDERHKMSLWIEEARKSGARQLQACNILGLSAKTYQRWHDPDNDQDGRINAVHIPPNKLSEHERQLVISIANDAEYAKLSPSKIVPKLADEGRYIASESTFNRILKEKKQMQHRLASKPKRIVKKPRSITATAPNQLYSWDITYLPSHVMGICYYLYLVMDVYSRKIVGWQVYEKESSALAADLMTDICRQERVQRNQMILHSDNGRPMKGATLLATLQQLGVVPSFSRPSVSNDNPFSESLFRPLKYRPDYPEKRFESLLAARQWVKGFVDGYNHEHLHSSIKFVTPEQRHNGDDKEVLSKRKDVYEEAKQKHPERWSGHIRNWDEINEVYLNPEKVQNKAA
jgi:transposase InsO family protein